MKLSIIIITYNSATDIGSCLEAINFTGDFEIIVIDNASQDHTREILNRYPNLKLLLNSKNLGYAHANNQGLSLARGEYILLLNPDAVVTPGAIDLLVAYLDQNPAVAAVAPKLLNPDGSTQLSIRSFPTFCSVLAELCGISRILPALDTWRRRSFDYEKPAFVEQPMASCLLIRHSVLKKMGGFDERFPIFYNDVDLSYRLNQQGYQTYYLPTARVYHKLGASTTPLKTKMIFENHRSLFRYLKKHTPPKLFWLQAVLLLPLLEISALVRILLWHLRKKGKRQVA